MLLCNKGWLSSRFTQLKNKENDQLVVHKSCRSRGRGRLWELLPQFKWQFKQGFTMLVVTRARRLSEWT